MEHVAYFLTLGAVLWFSMPALTARRQRALGVALAVLLPLFSWVWLVWIGVDYRLHAETRRRLADEQAERQRLAQDVKFWRDRARNGLPAEQEAARLYLDALGYAVEPGPTELHGGQLATASTESLAQMSRHYQAVLHAGALGPDGKAAYQAVQHELEERRKEEERDRWQLARMHKDASPVPPRGSFRIEQTANPDVLILLLGDGTAVPINPRMARHITDTAERDAQAKLWRSR